MKAPQCAGIIHSDFERGFIRAETVAYADLLEFGSMGAAKRKWESTSRRKRVYRTRWRCYAFQI